MSGSVRVTTELLHPPRWVVAEGGMAGFPIVLQPRLGARGSAAALGATAVLPTSQGKTLRRSFLPRQSAFALGAAAVLPAPRGQTEHCDILFPSGTAPCPSC